MTETTPAPPRSRLDPRKRTQILEAARQLFLAQGYEKTPIETVAEAAGVGIHTIYRHFENKECLFAAVIDRATSATPEMDDWIGQPLDRALATAGRLYLQALVGAFELGLYRVVVADSRLFPEFAVRFHRVFIESRHRVMAAYLAEQDRLGALAVRDPARSARLFAGMLKSAFFEDLLLGARLTPSEAEIRDHGDWAAEQFLRIHRPG